MYDNPRTKTECQTTGNQQHGVTTMAPPVDVYETKEAYGVSADMPGVLKDDINLRLEENTLRIEALSQPRRNTGQVKYERAFTLGKGVNLEDIQAELKHGVLYIRLPKAAKAKPKKIEIQSLN